MPIDFARIRNCLQDFDFRRLFIEELGWSHPESRSAVAMTVGDADFQQRIAYDLYYIDNWSMMFDLRILLLTIFSKKAYRNAY